MPTQIFDSLIYQGSWGTSETRAIFEDTHRTRSWLEILAALAEAQAEVGLIPAVAGSQVAETCRTVKLDEDFFSEVRRGFEATNHSTMGLIKAIQRRCPGDSGEWFYYGTTVQDVTDTWMMLAIGKVWQIIYSDLSKIEEALLTLAEAHRDTVMSGRTHGQQGLPISFGFKVAVWAREIRRHIIRMRDLRPRLGVGQLAGGVGSLSSYGPRGIELQEKFFSKLGLRAPAIVWNTARDVIVEWFQLLVLLTGSADKFGQEVYNLQRAEIGEVSEGFSPGTVGSITMPHKRNPEIAEHLGTLARVVRHNSAMIAESQTHDHERDGRSWKVEWVALPATCMAAAKSMALTKSMCTNLRVHPERMLANLEASKGYILSEAVMLALAHHVGKQTAHTLVYETAMRAHEAGQTLKEAVLENEIIARHLSDQELEGLFDYRLSVGLCPEFVDRVLRLAKEERAHDD
jgi:adenylosuccinate lyase